METWIEIDRNCPNSPWLMHQINASIALNAYWFLGNFILPALAIASPAPN